jgi:hypothetical protein
MREMPLPIKLKLDEKDVPVLDDGLPVFEFDDGTESPIDVAGSFKSYETKIGNFDEAKERHAEKLKATEKKLKAFKGVDIKKYEDGMLKIEAIKDQKLLDESGADSLKKSMRTIFDEEVAGIHASYKTGMGEKDEIISNMNTIVYDLAIKNKFATDKHFSGDKPVTIYNPDDAAKIYGSHFKVETTGSKYSIVAKDHEGKSILSRKKHGEPAEFSEAITQIIEIESKNKPILRNAKTGGPVTSGNLDSGSGDNLDGKDSLSKIKSGLRKYNQNH